MGGRRTSGNLRLWLPALLVALVAGALLLVRCACRDNTLVGSQRDISDEAIAGGDSAEEEMGPPSGAVDGRSDQVPMPFEKDDRVWTTVERENGELEQVATRLLQSYRDGADCVLAQAGYLDLMGLTWGCVVQGDGWTDICVVCTTSEEGVCEVRIARLEADEVAEVLLPDKEL